MSNEISKAKLLVYLNNIRRMEESTDTQYSSFEELLNAYNFKNEQEYNEAFYTVTLVDNDENVSEQLSDIEIQEIDDITKSWYRLFVRLEYISKNYKRLINDYNKIEELLIKAGIDYQWKE